MKNQVCCTKIRNMQVICKFGLYFEIMSSHTLTRARNSREKFFTRLEMLVGQGGVVGNGINVMTVGKEQCSLVVIVLRNDGNAVNAH